MIPSVARSRALEALAEQDAEEIAAIPADEYEPETKHVCKDCGGKGDMLHEPFNPYQREYWGECSGCDGKGYVWSEK